MSHGSWTWDPPQEGAGRCWGWFRQMLGLVQASGATGHATKALSPSPWPAHPLAVREGSP